MTVNKIVAAIGIALVALAWATYLDQPTNGNLKTALLRTLSLA
jgi:hypothetical protein